MSDDNVSKIIITGDATGVEAATTKAKNAVEGLGAAVKKVGADGKDALSPLGNGADSSAKKIDTATKSIIGSIQRTTAIMEAGEKGSAKYYEALAAQRGVNVDALKPYLAQLDAANAKHATATGSMNTMGMSAKQLSASLRGVPAQFTDIVTSLQSGQAPLTVFLQQGGQLKDMFGGAGNAAKALGGYVLGLLNPLTLTAGAAALLATAYHQGAAESEAFNKSLIMTGSIAGTTAGQLGDMAKTVAGSSGATIGAVAGVLNDITASGKVSADMLAKVAQAAVEMERAGGSAAADTVKEFASLGDAPVSAVIKLNDKYHFLTASVYDQIKALQDQGRETDAAKLAQDTYANAIESRVPSLVQNLGLLEKGWKGITSAAKGAWDVMAGVGRTESLNDQLASVNKKIEFGSSGPVWGDIYNNSSQASIPELEKQKRVIEAMISGEKSVADQVAQQNKAREAGLAWSQESTKYADQQAKKQAEILRVTTMMTEAGKTQTEIAKVLAQVEEKYAEKKGASARAVKEDFTELFQRAEQMKAIYAALGIEMKEIEKRNDDYAKSVASLIDPVEKEAASLERQAETYGLTRAQIEQTTIARLEEAKAMAAVNGAGDEAIAYYEREIDARKRIASASASIESRKATDDAAKHAANEWKKTADKIEDSITDALMRGFESGKSFAETLRDTVVNMFKTMVLKPVIQAVVVGGMSAAGMGSAAASDGSSSLGSLGNVASLGNSAYSAYAGGSSLYNSFALSGAGSALGLSAGLSTSLGVAGGAGSVMGGSAALAASEATAAGATGLTAAGSTIGMAIPYVGIAIAAAMAIASMMGKGGGPKTEGNYFGVLNGTGASTAQQYSTWGNHGTGYSGDSADGQLAQMAPAITTAITGIVGALGGSSAGVGINYGYNTDPEGDSEDQISAAVSDAAGNIVYGNHYSVEAGKYADALTLEVQRMTLASIKAAEGIKPVFKEYVAGIDLASASTETLNQAISDIQGIVGLRAAFENLNFGADSLSVTIIKAAGGVSALGTSLDSYYGNYFTEAERTAKTAAAVSSAFADMGIALPSSKEAFRALTEQIMSTGDAGAATFAKLMSLQGAFATVADAAKSAADAQAAAAKSAADAIKSEFLSMYQTLTDALGSAASSGDPTIGSRNYALGALDYTVASVQSGQSLLGFSDLIESAITELSKSSETLYSTFEEYALSQARAAASITYLQGNAYANSHASGLERVPYDGYQMTAHAGEAVVDAASVQAISRYFGSAPSVGNTARLEALVEALTQEVINLRAEAKATAGHTNRTANALSRVMPDGDALQTRVTA